MIDPMAGRKLSRERRSKILWTVPLVLLLLGATGWFMAIQRQQLRTVTFTIPPGTKAGQIAVEFPDEITLTIGVRDTIVIHNQDDDLHLFGPFVVAPHSTVTKRFNTPIVYQGACTFHQSQQMKLEVKPAPWDIWAQDD